MKAISNYHHKQIKQILATFAELKFDKAPPLRTQNQQRIAKQLLKKL